MNERIESQIKRVGFLLDSQKYDEVISACQTIISEDNRNSDAYNLMGVAYFKMNHFDLAEKNYRKAIELDNNNANAQFNFGLLRFTQKRYDDALSAVSTALSIKQGSGEYHKLLGFIMAATGKVPEAISELKKAIPLMDETKDIRAQIRLLQLVKSKGFVSLLFFTAFLLAVLLPGWPGLAFGIICALLLLFYSSLFYRIGNTDLAVLFLVFAIIGPLAAYFISNTLVLGFSQLFT